MIKWKRKGGTGMNILVTGGAGYIGSHTCVELLQAGHKVIVADNFSNSKPQALQAIEAITGKKPVFYQIDVADYLSLKQVFAENAIDGKTMLISCMLVNNETGAIYDIKALDAIRKRNAPDAYLHTDAVQGFCKLPYSLSCLGVDLISISGHKIHAPKGIGVLFIKKGIRIPCRMFGGGQEGTLRSGTENLAGIAAFAAAAEEFMNEKATILHKIKELNVQLRENLSKTCPYILINSEEEFAPHVLSISVPGIRSEIMLRFLSEKGIYVSAGSACSSKNADNRVLTNFGLDNKRADSTLRISFSKYNTQEEILLLTKALDEGNKSLIHTV